MNKTFLIIPGNDDTNRGDQALVWATRDLIKKAFGNTVKVKMVCDKNKSFQSIESGIDVLSPILEHPSRVFRDKNNLKYSILLKFKWGIVGLFDLLLYFPLLIPGFRAITQLFLSKQKKETLNQIKSCDSIFVKGGGFLHSGKGVAGWYKIFFCLFHIRLGLSLKKDVFVMPNSFGPINNRLAKRLCSRVLSKCKIVYARETISFKYLTDVLRIKNAKVMPDLGFALQKEQTDETVRIKNEILHRSGKKKLFGITVRPYRFDEISKNTGLYKRYVDSVVEFVKKRQSEGYFPVFFEHVYSDSYNEKDLIAIKDVSSKLSNGSFYIVSNKELNCKEMAELYTINSFLVGTRFHSVIFSFNYRVPCLAITYGGHKGTGILKDIGIENCGVPMHEVSFSSLESSYKYLMENYELVISKINAYVDKSRMEIDEIVKECRAI